ncbi:ECF transporter S component [Oscillospiraceae bacterium MB08-C2-2]|nr:ECF transporter S component [Oscillospiraceae bacterium MB08-C2-2]
MINKKNLRSFVQFSVLLALEAIVCFTPLGSLPAIGPMVATLSAIPVIITAIMLGTGWGSLMGFFFGLFSFLVWTFTPPSPIVAFLYTPFYSVGDIAGNFWSLVICFVPRILIGTVTGLVYGLLSKRMQGNAKKDAVVYGVSGVLGSLTNTFLVLGGVYIFFGRDYAAAIGQGFELLLGIMGSMILLNGLPEAVLGGLCAFFLCRALKKREVR